MVGCVDFGPVVGPWGKGARELEEMSRRVAGGLIYGCDDRQKDARRTTRGVAGAVAAAGLRLQAVAGAA